MTLEPRLKTSTKWSPFPEELCQMAVSALNERFANEYDLENSQFVVEGRIYEKEILGLYGLRIEGQLKQPNFVVSFEYDSEKEKALELIQKSMDVVEHLWTELLEDDLEDGDMPKEWQTMPFEKRMYYFRYSTQNTHLEQEADKWLENYEKKLVYGESKVTEEEDLNPSDKDKSTLH
jgi:hypothetical protein